MRFKVPSLWGFVSEFPFTDTGKLQKYKLRDDVQSGAIKVSETRSARQAERQE